MSALDLTDRTKPCSEKREPRIEKTGNELSLQQHGVRTKFTTPTFNASACANLTCQNGPNSLPFQQSQILTHVFQHSFASFLYGTCSKSVSKSSIELEMKFTAHRAPFPQNVTVGVHTERAGLRTTNNTVASSGRRSLRLRHRSCCMVWPEI